MGLAGLFATAFVVGLSGAMGPGSLLVVVVTESAKQGFWAGPAAIVGHGAIEVLMVLLLYYGLAKSLGRATVLGAVGLLGGLALLALGYSTIKSAKDASLGATRSTEGPSATLTHKGLHKTALSGIAASISNPYWIMWWATVGAAYVATASGLGMIGVWVFFLGHILADLSWYSLVAFGVSKGTKVGSDNLYRGLLRLCGAFLLLFGVYFLWLGVGNLAG